jgi:predicted dehydrogenase
MEEKAMARVTTALIGCGVRGLSYHGPVTKASEKLDLVAVCDVDEARRTFASQKLGVPAVADYHALLARPDLQSVIVVTPARYHAPIALDAIRAGKHVLVEKPLADSPEAAYGLADAAEKAGVVGMVCYPTRMSSYGKNLKRICDQIEPIQGLFTAQRGPLNAMFFMPEHFGGIVDDTTHTIHLAVWCMGGKPSGVFASIGRGNICGDQTIDRFDLVVEFDGGNKVVTIVSSMLGLYAENLVQVIGNLGLVSSTDRRSLRVVRHPPITEPGRRSARQEWEKRRAQIAAATLGPVDELTLGRPIDVEIEKIEESTRPESDGGMDDHFADVITGATRLQGASLRDGGLVVQITDAAVRSVQTGTRITLL